MMNKSKIQWTEMSWNPITGCRHNCEYCYARKQARRFSGDIRLNKGTGQMKQYLGDVPSENVCYVLPQPFRNAKGRVVPFPVGFEPTLHEYRLCMPAQRKKPTTIFVCSMADLFGAWVPDEWIKRVFDACEAAPWHNYLFLTKNPQRYTDLANAGALPEHDNWWYGTSVTKKGDKFFGGRITDHIFLSIEPLHESLDAGLGSFGGAEWIIVGAETGIRPGKITPKREWIENIIEAASITQAAVFLKNSKEMDAVWGAPLIQQLPPELEREDDPEIPHCKACGFAMTEEQGKRGTLYRCGLARAKHIPGRHTRTSPRWCPIRNSKEANKNE